MPRTRSRRIECNANEDLQSSQAKDVGGHDPVGMENVNNNQLNVKFMRKRKLSGKNESAGKAKIKRKWGFMNESHSNTDSEAGPSNEAPSTQRSALDTDAKKQGKTVAANTEVFEFVEDDQEVRVEVTAPIMTF